MNESVFKGKWKEFKGEVQSQWGKLTADDLEQTKGNVKAIIGLIEQKYGEKKEEVLTKVNALAKRFEIDVDEKVSDAKSSVAKSSENVKKIFASKIIEPLK